ncbi:MAG: flagellar hook-associated protein FlgL [Myxococcota bacterium]
MGTRITQSMLYRMSLANLDRTRGQLARTQEQASSGLRINRPSDDPLGAGTALTLRAATDAVEQLLRNGSAARARVAALDDALASTSDLVIRARELAVQGANSPVGDSTAEIAREIESLFGALVANANTRYGGGYIFAGYAAEAAPFTTAGAFSDAPPTAPTVSFVGDSGEIQVGIEEGQTVRVTLDGRRVFQGDADGDGNPDAGRVDLFQVFGDLRNALVAGDETAIGAALPELDTALRQLGTERTAAGGVLSQLDAAEQRLANQEVRLASRLSEVQDADLARVVSDLVRQETALQAGLSAMGRLMPPNLLDFLA